MKHGNGRKALKKRGEGRGEGVMEKEQKESVKIIERVRRGRMKHGNRRKALKVMGEEREE